MKRFAWLALVALVIGGFTACKAAGGGGGQAASGGGVVEAGVVEFTFVPLDGQDVDSIYLVGDFNGWVPEDPNMMMEEDGGTYYLEYELDPGTYYFKFFIDGEWIQDAEEYDGNFTPAVSEYQGDGFGGQNAVLEVE